MSTSEKQNSTFATDTPHAAVTPFSSFTADGLDRIRRMYAALVPSREGLAALFAVQAAQTAPTEQWTAFFIETASAQVIWDERPTGTLIEADARLLLARFDEAPSFAVLKLLVRVLEEAHCVPDWYAAAVQHRAVSFRPSRGPAKPRSSHLRLVA